MAPSVVRSFFLKAATSGSVPSVDTDRYGNAERFLQLAMETINS